MNQERVFTMRCPSNRGGGLRTAVLLLVASAAPLTSDATVRTVSYMGVASSQSTNVEVANSSYFSGCTLVIANNGENSQIIKSITASVFFPGTNKTYLKSTSTGSWISSTLVNTDGTTVSGNGGTGCIDHELKKGGICVVQYNQITLTWTGRISYCTGTVTAADADTSKPGSLVASGSIIINQETQVMGGILSGAYYASGVHIRSEDLGVNVANDNEGDFQGDYADTNWGGNANQMNIFCQSACRADQTTGDWSAQECNEHCGLGTRSYGTDGGNLFTATTGAGKWYYPIVGFDRAIDITNDSHGDAFGYDPDSSSSNTGHNQIRTYHGVTNGHFAGGMVYEMTIGGLTGVCSGNRQFFEDGGFDFTHADGVDTHASYYANDPAKFPPERLVCSHRHSRPELFMRTGSMGTILVNGGSPF